MNHDGRLDAALRYVADLRWPVFPLNPPRPDDGKSGKLPLTEHGFRDASVRADEVCRWWRRWPEANIGVPTGQPTGCVVLDIDPRHGGDKALAALERQQGPLPKTVESLTGGGGRHLFFAHPGGQVRNRASLFPGIDVRGDGGYIVAPPSGHYSGGSYRWKAGHAPFETALAAPPPWLAEALAKRPEHSQEPPEIPPADQPADNGRDRLVQEARRYAAKAKAVAEGERNDAAFNLAGHLAAFVVEGTGLRLTEAEVLDLLRGWNHRNRPPLPDDELERVMHSAAVNGRPRKPHVVRANAAGESKGKAAGHTARPSQADLLVGLTEQAELFHTPGGHDSEGYATAAVRGHRETYPVSSKPFRRWLRRRFWGRYRKAPRAQAMQDALGVIASKAIFDGPERPVAVRLTEGDGVFWLDLADEEWRAVRITPAGWQIVADPPVRFLRPRGMLPLPAPVSGGSLAELRQLINVPDEGGWALLSAWMVGAMRPHGPYPILNVGGEQGSGKSTACRMVRAVLDPNEAPLRSEPREVRDLMIAASNSLVLAFDNISHIPPWLSDALCRLATGGGFATRELYSDTGEVLLSATRPVIVNGIEDLPSRPDLLDRTITLVLPTILDENRLTEAELWGRFRQIHARVLGALLDAVSVAMLRLPDVRLQRLPRMADFATWATAAEEGLGVPEGAFMAAYHDDREGASALALEASAIGPAVLALMADRPFWEGIAQELLNLLNSRVDDATRYRRDWPRNPRKLAGDLRRLAPTLRAVHIQVTFHRESRRRLIRLEGSAGAPSPSSSPSRRPRRQDRPNDAAAGAGDGVSNESSCGNPIPEPDLRDGDGGDGATPEDSDPMETWISGTPSRCDMER